MKLADHFGTDRLLLIVEDPVQGDALRRRLARQQNVLESRTFEEGLVILEGQSAGITLLVTSGDLGAACRHVDRLRELFPDEIAIVGFPGLDLASMRRLARAGAFDALDLTEDESASLEDVMRAAASRLIGSAHRRQTEQARVLESVLRHERDSAGAIVDAHGASGAWAGLGADVRTRWLNDYIKHATSHDGAQRAAFQRELASELSRHDEAAELLLALHVQAMSCAHGQAELGMQRARNLLIDLMAETMKQRAESGTSSDASALAAAPPTASWHRWRLGGEETWWLVVDGWIRAHVRVGPSSVEGSWIDPSTKAGVKTARVHSGLLPRLPEALREVERRVNSGYVLEVVTADAA